MTILLCVFHRNRHTSLTYLFDNFRFEIILYRLPIYLILYTELFAFQAKLHPSISFLPISIFIFKRYLFIRSEFLKLYLVYSHVWYLRYLRYLKLAEYVVRKYLFFDIYSVTNQDNGLLNCCDCCLHTKLFTFRANFHLWVFSPEFPEIKVHFFPRDNTYLDPCLSTIFCYKFSKSSRELIVPNVF